jgi:translation elongation factor EF-Tu-like GTPase
MATYAEVWIELLTTQNGGRTSPIYLSTDLPSNYRPHLRVRGGDGEYLGVEFVDGPDGPVEPGGNTFATVRFVYQPEVNYDALIVGAEFEIMEGGKIVGTGRVTRI